MVEWASVVGQRAKRELDEAMIDDGLVHRARAKDFAVSEDRLHHPTADDSNGQLRAIFRSNKFLPQRRRPSRALGQLMVMKHIFILFLQYSMHTRNVTTHGR